MEPNHYIYLTTNKVNGRKYVGRCCAKSWNTGYIGSGVFLKQAIEKYGGRKNFKREILQEIRGSLDEAIQAEIHWIAHYDAVNNKEFYNMSESCGGFDKGDKHTEETKQLISERTSEAMKAKGREYYATRNQSGTGRAPSNKGKKFLKGTPEYERRYGKKRKPSSRPTKEKAEQLKERWDVYIQSGGISERKFCADNAVSRGVLRGILAGTYIPAKVIYRKLDQINESEIVNIKDAYYNKGMKVKELCKTFGIKRTEFRKICPPTKSRQ